MADADQGPELRGGGGGVAGVEATVGRVGAGGQGRVRAEEGDGRTAAGTRAVACAGVGRKALRLGHATAPAERIASVANNAPESVERLARTTALNPAFLISTTRAAAASKDPPQFLTSISQAMTSSNGRRSLGRAVPCQSKATRGTAALAPRRLPRYTVESSLCRPGWVGWV